MVGDFHVIPCRKRREKTLKSPAGVFAAAAACLLPDVPASVQFSSQSVFVSISLGVVVVFPFC